jgi:spermidine dehydrogenase
MPDKSRDRELGMDRPITRRDFLNGVAFTAAGAGFGLGGIGHAALAAVTSANPPALDGLRGHGETAMAVMHAIRDGDFWKNAPPTEATGETYDLVVVGGGISGLAAAFLYRQQVGDEARILILENNDDFGGHARRNEFRTSDGRLILGYGGSQSLQTPSYFSPLVNKALADIGIQMDAFGTWYDAAWHEERELGDAVFFSREVFGSDALVRTTDTAAEWVPLTPLNDKAKRDLVELIDRPRDYLPGKSREEKLEILSRTTYAEFLTGICGYDPQLVAYFQNSTQEYFGLGIDGTTALDAWGNYNPGFTGMELGDAPHRAMSPSGRLALTDPDDYIHHFPDGNASVARAFVRAMIPGAVPGAGMESLVLDPVDYAGLDNAANPVRLRLNASVVRVRHDGEPQNASSVTLTYVEEGRLKSVQAAHVVLACWHRVIPHIAEEVSAGQAEALNDQVKIPLVYANVLIGNWKAFDRLGIGGFHTPKGYWLGAEIDYPVSVGSYKFADEPSDPVLLHMGRIVVPGEPGMSAREQAVAGRYQLFETSFEEMERQIRDTLARALKDGGFDPARDIEAITINRWSHGYALEYMRPWDQFWPDGSLPILESRKPWGRIAIANSDAGAYAYVHSAIDQAGRAVKDLLGDSANLPEYADFPGPPRDMIGL